MNFLLVLLSSLICTFALSKSRARVTSFQDRNVISSGELKKCRDFYRHNVFDKKITTAILPLAQCMFADKKLVHAKEWHELFVHAQLVDQSSPSSEVRYAMALMQHRLSHPDQAWRYLLAAKSTQEKLPVEASREQNAILSRIGGGSSFWAGLGPKSKVPVFVVGMSERTVALPLIEALSRHASILLPPQNGSVFEAHHAEVWAAAAASYRDDEGSASMRSSVTQSTNQLLNAYSALIEQHKPTAKHVLDVSFHNYKSLGFLHMHFPHALIIHIARDPLDSLLDVFFSSDIEAHPYAADIHTAAQEYSEYIKLMAYWRQVLPRNRFVELSYDTLVTSESGKNKAIKEILIKLKLPTNAMLDMKPMSYVSLPVGSWLEYKQFLEPVRKQMLKDLDRHFKALSESALSTINWKLDTTRYTSQNKKTVASVLDDEYDEYDEYEEYGDAEGYENEEGSYDEEYDEEVYDEEYDEEVYDEEVYDEEYDEEVYDEEYDEEVYDEEYDEEVYDEAYDEAYDEEYDEEAYDEEYDDEEYDDEEYDGEGEYDYEGYDEYEDYGDEEEDVLLHQSDDTRYIHIPSTTSGDFARLGISCGTDKATRHGYYRFYPRFTEHLRKATGGGMLEIGVNQEHSLCLWLQYFPKAFVYGIDVNVSGAGDRYKIFKMDQSKRSDLEKLISRKMLSHPIFLVVDDGSHIPEHQLLSFDIIFNQVLKPGGTYVIEDVETSYWRKYGVYGYETHYGYHHKKSTVEMFKYIADDVNFECLNSKSKESQTALINGVLSPQTRKMISSVTFAQNTIIITKKTVAEQKKYGYRDYPYAVAL